MMLSVPARVAPPARTALVPTTADGSRSVSVTLVMRDAVAGGHRMFAFPPAREESNSCPAACAKISREPLPEARDGEAGTLPWMRAAEGSSSGFLAGLIAQGSTGVQLHDPQHEVAVREYRNAEQLGRRGAPRVRRDTTI
jgi:hypothetical protein